MDSRSHFILMFYYFIIVNFLFSLQLVAQSNTYYVSKSGNDGNDGSLATPWLTIQGAIENTTVSDGDIIIVNDGEYLENVTVTKQLIIKSKNGYEATTVRPVNTGASVILVQANNITIDGFTTYGAIQHGNHFIASIYLASVSNCTISNNRCGYDATHYSEKSIMLYNSDNNLISNNICNYSPDIGLQFYNGSDNNTVQNNICSNNGYNYPYAGSGITNSDLNNKLRSNIIENNEAYGVHIYSGSVNLGNNDTNDKGNNIIQYNGLYDVYNGSGTTTNAYYNYWGSNDEATIASHISGSVNFNPWLDISPLPIELTSFSATTTSSVNKSFYVLLNWQTATEVNNYGFEIERASTSSATEKSWEKIGFVEGHGNSNSKKIYQYTDNSISVSGKYKYRLKQIDIDGKFEYSKTVEINLVPPSKFELEQNYPNPFNPTTTIKYSIPLNVKRETENVKLVVYDILGNEVEPLVNEVKQSGVYEIKFDAMNYSSGVYYYQLIVGNFIQTKKMMLLK